MASDATTLIVRLEAKLDSFERELKRAGVIADDRIRGIEDRAKKSSSAMTAVGTAIGSALATGVTVGGAKAIEFVEGLVRRFQALGQVAKLTGLDLERVYAAQEAFSRLSREGPAAGGASLSSDQVNKGLTEQAKLLERGNRGEDNSLATLFKINDVDIGKIKTVEQSMEIVAGLVQNARTELQKIDIAEAAGLSREWVSALEKGPEALKAAQAAAAAAAPDLEKMAKLAAEFDDAWRAATDAIRSYFLDNLGGMRAGLADFVATTGRELEALGAVATKVRNFFGRSGQAPIDGLGDGFREVERRIRGQPEEFGPPAPRPPRPAPGQGTPTRNPNAPLSNAPPVKSGGGGGGSSGPDPDRFFDAQLRRTKERAEDIELETRMLGANTAERIKAKAALDLQQAARRGEVTLTGEQIASLEREAAKLGEVTSAYELARQRQSQSLALQNFAGQELLSVLDRIGEKGMTVGSIVEDLARSLVRSAAQAALLGTGPLAGLLGTAAPPGSGNAGGLIGAAFAAFKGIGANADGTDNWRGGLSLVGERGPEIVNLPRGAQVIPNDILRARAGSGSSNVAVMIDVRGATGNGEIRSMVAAGMAAAVVQAERQVGRNLLPMMRTAQLRYVA